jgi:serine/threonine protein kinase
LERLKHPFIIQIYEVGTFLTQDKTQNYITLEFFQGMDLHTHIRVLGKMSWQQGFQIAEQLLQALHFMHSLGIIHRDIKPHNILYNEITKIPKIIDLGLGKCFENFEQRSTVFITHSNTALGTPDFMPIEQWYNSREVSFEADIYSLGATLYYLLAGNPPHGNHSTLGELYQAVLHQEIIPLKKLVPSSVPPPFLEWIQQMIAYHPEDRYPTSKKALLSLQDLKQELKIL